MLFAYGSLWYPVPVVVRGLLDMWVWGSISQFLWSTTVSSLLEVKEWPTWVETQALYVNKPYNELLLFSLSFLTKVCKGVERGHPRACCDLHLHKSKDTTCSKHKDINAKRDIVVHVWVPGLLAANVRDAEQDANDIYIYMAMMNGKIASLPNRGPHGPLIE